MNGILCLDKPQNTTSFACCAKIRRLLGEKKVGHAGTLDPMATGVLPLLVGRATRALDLLPIHDKRYIATLRFGFTSDTLDIWGHVEPTGGTPPALEAIREVLPAFRGDICQVPPMMSALKRDGVRLYDLARQGIEVERPPRTVTLHALDVIGYDEAAGELTLDCLCSRGTYIRTLCDDLGRLLGCGAVMTALRRTMAAGFSLDGCLSLEQAEMLAGQDRLADRLLPVENAFALYPAVAVTAAQASRFCNGGALSLERLRTPVKSPVRVHGPGRVFLGLGRPEDGELKISYLSGEKV